MHEFEVDRTLPSSPEAETGALSSFMLNCDKCLELVGDKLKPEHFQNPANRIVFETIIGLQNAGSPYDMISLTAEFQKRRVLDAVGGASRLAEISGAVPTTGNIQYFVEVLLDCYHRRELIRVANGLETSAYESAEDLPEAIKVAEETIKGWREQVTLDEDPTNREGWLDLIEALEERQDKIKEGKLAGVPTGIPWVNQLTQGWQPETFYLIGGRPSDGKSALLSQFAINACRAKREDGRFHKVLIFSLEMSGLKWRERMLAQWGAVTSHILKSGIFSESNFQEITHAVGHLRDHVFVYANGRLTMTDIRRAIKRGLAMHPDISWIGIDYLQIVKSEDTRKASNQDQRIGAIAQEINDLKFEFGLPIIACAALNRGQEDTKERRPRLSSIRECGQIEYIIDTGMLLWPEENTEGLERNAKIIFAKNRDGSTDERQFVFNKNKLIFAEPVEKRKTYHDNL